MKKKLLFGFMAVMLVAGTILAGCVAPAPEEGPAPAPKVPEGTWKFQRYYSTEISAEFAAKMPDFRLYEDTYTALTDAVAKKSNGKFTIKQYLPGELFSAMELWGATSRGSIEMCEQCGGIYAGENPVGLIEVGVPFLTESLDDVRKLWLESDYWDMIRDIMAKDNLYYLGPNTLVAPNTIFSKGWEFDSLASIKGKKIRAPGGGVAMVVENLGGVALAIPISETYLALQRGTADGAMLGVECAFAIDLWEVTDNITLHHGDKGIFFWNNCVVINLDSWNSLPEEYQDLLNKTMRDRIAYVLEEAGPRQWEDMKSALGDTGMNIVVLTDEEYLKIKEACIPTIWDDISEASPENAKIMAHIRKVLEK